MSLKILNYLFDTDEYLCEGYNRETGREIVSIPFSKVGCFVDVDTVIGKVIYDDKYYFIRRLPENVSSMIVESKNDATYKIEVTRIDGTIKYTYLTERDMGEEIKTGDYLEFHLDNKFYTDHKATYEASKRIESKFDLLKKRSQEKLQ